MTDAVKDDTVLDATGNQGRLARVYAEALHAAAARAGQADSIGQELQSFAGLISTKPRIAAFLGSAAVSRKSRLDVLGATFAGNASPLFQNFLGVLNKNNRLGLLLVIARAYRDLEDRLAGRIRVRVKTAAPLSATQTDRLIGTLTTKLGRQPILTVTVDANLLGGLVVQVGDRVYDSSVRTRLETLRTNLLSSGTHVLQA